MKILRNRHMQKIGSGHYDLIFVDADTLNNCSIYVCLDFWHTPWWSFIFCDRCDILKARKCVRLEACMPVAIKEMPPCLRKKEVWDFVGDGYGTILNKLLERKNSLFPCYANWDRMRILFHKYMHKLDDWKRYRFHSQQFPDYREIWGTCSWRYGDEDPDGCIVVVADEELNLSLYSSVTDYDMSLLVFDDFNRFKAKKAAKLNFLKPEYLAYVPNDFACFKTEWRLNRNDVNNILKLLASSDGGECTYWRRFLDMTYGSANFTWGEDSWQAKLFENPDELSIPDYRQLPGLDTGD